MRSRLHWEPLGKQWYHDAEKGLTDTAEEANRLEGQIREHLQLQTGILALKESRKSIEVSNQQIQENRRVKTITILAFIYVPLTLTTSIYGMNLQQLNGSGQTVWIFVVTAVIALVITAGTWYLSEAVNTYRNWHRKRADHHDRVTPHRSIKRPDFNVAERVAMIVWLLRNQYLSWMKSTGVWWKILLNSGSPMHGGDYGRTSAGDLVSRASLGQIFESLEQSKAQDPCRTNVFWEKVLWPATSAESPSSLYVSAKSVNESYGFNLLVAAYFEALWAHGIHGAGKTVLLSMVVNHLNAIDKQEHKNRVACVYCEYNQAGLQSPENLLASIWRQLLRDQDSLAGDVKDLWQERKRGITRPSMEQVMAVLIKEVAKLSVFSILIDAVDELSPKVQKVLLQKIQSLLAMPKLKGTRIRLMFSSRQEKSPIANAEVVEVVAAEKDVRLFVEKCIEDAISPASVELSDLVRQNLNLKKSIISAVTEQSQGMFLLARLYMDLLGDQVSLKKLRNTIQKLPHELNEIYEEAWKRVQQQSPGLSVLAQQAIQWLSSSYTQMTIKQLRQAIATEENDSDIDDENLPATDILTAACQGLVKIDRESGIIRLAHFTTYEFFHGMFSKDLSGIHQVLARTCLTFLMFNVFDQGPCKYVSSRATDMIGLQGGINSSDILSRRIAKYPFMRYAAWHWADHARMSPERAIQTLITAFFKQPRRLASTIQVRYLESEFVYDADLDAKYPGSLALHAAVCYGLEATVGFFLASLSGREINGVDCRGKTAIHWAVELKSTAIAVKLLQVGADLESRIRGERFAWVVHTGPNRSMRYRAGDDISQETVLSGDLVYICVETEQVDVLQCYLMMAVDQLGREARATNILFKASLLDRPKLVRLALDHGVAIDQRGGQGKTPLEVAVENTHVTTVQSLLQYGASISIDCTGHALIQSVIENQHVFEERLAAGAANDVVFSKSKAWLRDGAVLPLSRSRKTHRQLLKALHEDRSQKRIIEALLSQGANSFARTCKGETLLYLAVCSAGRLGVLLERSSIISDINLHDCNGRTAIHYAAAAGNPHAMLVLLSHGANINARDNNSATPLHYASETYECTLVALRSGATVDATDKLGRNALHYHTMLADDPDPNNLSDWQTWKDTKSPAKEYNERLNVGNPHFSSIPRNCDAETMSLLCQAFEKAQPKYRFAQDLYGFAFGDHALSTRAVQRDFEETTSWLKQMKKRYQLRTAAIEEALAHALKQAKQEKKTWTMDQDQLLGQRKWWIKDDTSTDEVLEPGRPLESRTLTFDGDEPEELHSGLILLIPR
ncbi:MAG: hypothetical protein Q9226_007010 [Calogaya cf. arnoldii]